MPLRQPLHHNHPRRHRSRRSVLLGALCLVAVLACNLTAAPAPEAPPGNGNRVTATLSSASAALLNQPSTSPTTPAISTAPASRQPAPSFTPSQTASATASSTAPATALATALSPSPSPGPSQTFTPVPTLAPAFTPPASPLFPLDDGSGRPIAGTGSDQSTTLLPGVDELPTTLYFISDQTGITQVWRLRVGLSAPDQVSFSTSGVAAFDVAPNGVLAYITPDGELFVGGVPVSPLIEDAAPRPQATAIAWAPTGGWLAYVLRTPGAEATNGEHPVDGVWIRNADGMTLRIATTTYTSGSSGAGERIFRAPLDWRPDGTEVLAHLIADGQSAASRINITTSQTTLIASESTLPPGTYREAQWLPDASALLIVSDATIARVAPDTLQLETLLAPLNGYTVRHAVPLADGRVLFIGRRAENTADRIYSLRPGDSPQPISEELPPGERIEFAAHDQSAHAVLVSYASSAELLGTPWLHDAGNVRHDLTPLIGRSAAPQWGALFEPGDPARIRTTGGDALNMRAAPGGAVVFAVVSGVRVTILDGPRLYDGLRWWRIRTADGIAGWAAEAVRDERGQVLRTLNPTQ